MTWQRWQGSDQEWDELVSRVPHASFSQSSAWKNFQRALGREVVRLVIPAKAGIQSHEFCQLARVKKTVGSYWLAQRGPITDDVSLFISQAPSLLPSGAWFMRLEPTGVIPAKAGIQSEMIRRDSHDPSVTRLLDLSKSEEELLAEMHQKTRYNIRVAEKHGISVFETDSLEEFLSLQKDTASRDNFSAQSDAYIKKQFDSLKADGLASVWMAQKNEEALAANVVIAYGDTVTYLYGASSSAHRNLMAPYLLQWEIIKWAKQNGYRWYDFWGCNPESETHPDYKSSWEGITRFKSGWGGELVEYAGTYDLPLNKFFYNLARLIGK